MRQTDKSPPSGPWYKRYLTRPVGGAATWLVIRCAGLLPIDIASAVTGGIARGIGPGLRVSERARINLRQCFPDWPEARIKTTVTEMWDNLGRIAGEFPHLNRLDFSGADRRIEFVGREHVAALVASGGPGILFAAHTGNWEMLTMLGKPLGLRLTMIYRSMNAPLADRVLRHAGGPDAGMIPKGAGNARRLARVLRNNDHIGMLVDQKLNEGIDVPFFGRPAPTAQTVAFFALRYRCPVLPVRVIRLGGARFRITFDPPLDLPDSGDITADTAALTATINRTVEAWVREYPGQWMWLHRRWRK